MRDSEKSLPNYAHPPLVEVAMSVEFEQPQGFSLPQLGLFWSQLKTDFPRVQAVQPIPSSAKDFEEEGVWLPPQLHLEFSDHPVCRLQMISEDDQWMCQLQPDRFVINWRKRSSDYPRYGATLDRFAQIWSTFESLLQSEKFDAPKPRLWELTYVNRIPQGKLWQTVNDFPSVLPGLWGGPFTSIGQLKLNGLRSQWVWDQQSPRARLFVETLPAQAITPSPNDVLLLKLTARGPIKNESGAGSLEIIQTRLNTGHELIVMMFDAVVSTNAKRDWGRQ